ncbi:hypothetical protein PMAYCL1PPCAC_31743, partial [Pristionchus mayeri]
GAGILTLQAFRVIKSLYDSPKDEWIPVGTVKHLRVFPVKSCRGHEVFSVRCGPLGVSIGGLHDREFLEINGKTGGHLTARAFPKMILMQCNASEGVLTVSIHNGRSVDVILDDVVNNNVVRRATMHKQKQADGLDCGDAVGALFDKLLGVADTRVLYYQSHLFNGRPCIPKPNWWNNPVPKRKDTIRYADLAPYLITTEESLHALMPC